MQPSPTRLTCRSVRPRRAVTVMGYSIRASSVRGAPQSTRRRADMGGTDSPAQPFETIFPASTRARPRPSRVGSVRDGRSEVAACVLVVGEPVRLARHGLLLGLAQRREAHLIGRNSRVRVGPGELLTERARDDSPGGNLVACCAQQSLLAGSLLR